MKSRNATLEEPVSIEDLIRRKHEIDQAIRRRYERPIVVMFTDIAASTGYFETYGDLAGREMLQRHNDILLPVVEKHQGRLVKPLGDGLMIAFEDPLRAARGAVEIQKTLDGAQSDEPPDSRIQLKISIHYGKGIVEENDIYGDVVNTSARLNSLASKGQILVSRPFLDAVKDHGFDYRFEGIKSVKGKSRPLEVYRLIWDPVREEEGPQHEPFAGGEEKTRGAADTGGLKDKLLRLEVSLEDGRIKAIPYRCDEAHPAVQHVLEKLYPQEEVRQLVHQVERRLATAHGKSESSGSHFADFRTLCGRLYELVLPAALKDFLSGAGAETLILRLDDRLVHIPWELLWDGEAFLCLRYAMGRMVSTSKHMPAPSRPLRRPPLRMLVVTNPRDDLDGATEEGETLKRTFHAFKGLVDPSLNNTITVESFAADLCQYDLLHYAGHAVYDTANPPGSSLLLKDGEFQAGRLVGIARSHPLPSLVFSNACQSSRSENWRLGEEAFFGLANAFLTGGVRHYIGSIADLYDQSSANFVRDFYEELLAAHPVGEALRQARLKWISSFGEASLTWACYNLYGDPTFTYFRPAVDAKEPKEAADRALLSRFRRRAAGLKRVALAAGLAGLLGLLIFAGVRMGLQEGGPPGGPDKAFSLVHEGHILEAKALLESLKGQSSLYHSGMFSMHLGLGHVTKAKADLETMARETPRNPYLPVAQAHLALVQGNLQDAESAYMTALEGNGMARWQLAEARFGLGRVFLHKGELSKAVSAFDQALRADPSFLQAHTAMGLALERMGKPREAVEHYRKAVSINPEDPVSAGLLRRAVQRRKSREEVRRRERIDQLVQELLEVYREGGQKPQPGDDAWSSRPLYCIFLDLEPRGELSHREGEDAFLAEQLLQEMSGSTRLHLVERALLEKLMEELKLSATRLADKQTALRLGRILSARIIVAGTVVRYGGRIQLTLRAIDVETTRIAGVASGTLQSDENLAQMARRLSTKLLQEIRSEYPLRGRILEVEQGKAVIDIGAQAGLEPGMRLAVTEGEGRGTRLEVQEVREETSILISLGKGPQPQPGWRLEEVAPGGGDGKVGR